MQDRTAAEKKAYMRKYEAGNTARLKILNKGINKFVKKSKLVRYKLLKTTNKGGIITM